MRCFATKSMSLVTGRFIQPIRFLFFHQMKMSECETFSKGSIFIELRPMEFLLFLCEK